MCSPFSLLLIFLMFVVALQITGVVCWFCCLSCVQRVGGLDPPGWSLFKNVKSNQNKQLSKSYPFFGFLEAYFVVDAEGIMIFVFPPLRHLDCSYLCKASIMYDVDDFQNYKCLRFQQKYLWFTSTPRCRLGTSVSLSSTLIAWKTK